MPLKDQCAICGCGVDGRKKDTFYDCHDDFYLCKKCEEKIYPESFKEKDHVK